MSNEIRREHFTPVAIRLMVNILFAEDDTALTGANRSGTMYDPRATGDAHRCQEHMKQIKRTPCWRCTGRVEPETWAICRSDLAMGPGPDRSCSATPRPTPMAPVPRSTIFWPIHRSGVDWKKMPPHQAEHDPERFDGRVTARSLPRYPDGAAVLLHMV